MKRVLIILLVIFAYSATFAQNASKRISEFNLENKIAIQGYDPVSYFKQNKAIKGKKELVASYEGVLYQFSSSTNKLSSSKLSVPSFSSSSSPQLTTGF